jgi:hypothetical protein
MGPDPRLHNAVLAEMLLHERRQIRRRKRDASKAVRVLGDAALSDRMGRSRSRGEEPPSRRTSIDRREEA